MENFSLYSGMLYIRKEGPVEILAFETAEKWRMRQIGKFEDGKFGPNHVFYHECLRDECGTGGQGTLISILLANDNDLSSFFSSYKNEKVSLEEWAEEVCDLEDLDQKEKKRIKEILRKIQG